MSDFSSKIRTYFLNMKIRNKVLFIFILIGVFPFLCYIILSRRYTNQLILEREKTLTELTLEQAVTSIENQLEIYNNLSNYMFNNTSILDVLNTEYGSGYFQMYKAYQDVIEPLFQTYYALHPDLDKITIYSSCDLHPYNGYIQPLSALKNLEWFPLVDGEYIPTWTIWEQNGEKYLYSTRLIGDTNKYRTLNYLCLQVDYDSLFTPFLTVAEGNYTILITDSNNSCVFTNNPDFSMSLDQFMSEYSEKRYMLRKDRLEAARWNVYFAKPYNSLVEYVHGVTNSIYAFGLIILLLLGIMIIVFSVSVVAPIETLTSKIRTVSHGDMSQLTNQLSRQLTLELKKERNDEIGILFQNFSQMIGQIHYYIEVNLKNELEKKNYQQKILYAQINPHFLYNSLSLINSRAILSEQDDISNMVILLSTFYRTALNKGKDTTTLENELQNIQAYIQIQLLSYSENIDVAYDIDPVLPSVSFPNFILQPLVENALDHGLKNSPRPDKRLHIIVKKELADTILIIIEDNGIGMSEKTIASLFQIETSGYGMKNVNDRLKLFYGDRYSLIIHSRPGDGTKTVLRLPGK